MRAGDLRYRLQVKTKTATKDAEGNTTAGYAEAGKIWANHIPGGGEFIRSRFGITDESVTGRIECRPNPLIVPTNVIVWDGLDYEIANVQKPEPGKWVALLRRL